MLLKSAISMALLFGWSHSCLAQEQPESKPVELEALQGYVGVWDADIEVWPQGLDSPSIKFQGVEANRAYGEYWIASDFDSEYMGQTMRVHSIVGYDLDKQMIVGTNIDDGPYAAQLTGRYDAKAKTIHFKIAAKAPDGSPMMQKTTITQTSDKERVLVLMVPGEDKAESTKFMQITFTRRDE